MSKSDVVVVFTAKSVERILEEGGTSSWRLDPAHARQCPYAVCTRNAHADWVEGSEPHHSAFLIGRVNEVVRAKASPENDRQSETDYLIRFSQFARISVPEVWSGDRNPVRYRSLEDLGIDPAKLKWEDMPKARDAGAAAAPPARTRSVGALSLAEAKRGLALTFNVPPEAIEITIRG